MRSSAVEEELERLRDWSLDDLQALLEGLRAIVRQREAAKPLYDVRDFRGIGHGTWEDVDIDEYIRRERASWDI